MGLWSRREAAATVLWCGGAKLTAVPLPPSTARRGRHSTPFRGAGRLPFLQRRLGSTTIGVTTTMDDATARRRRRRRRLLSRRWTTQPRGGDDDDGDDDDDLALARHSLSPQSRWPPSSEMKTCFSLGAPYRPCLRSASPPRSEPTSATMAASQPTSAAGPRRREATRNTHVSQVATARHAGEATTRNTHVSRGDGSPHDPPFVS